MNLDDYFILDRMQALEMAKLELLKNRVCCCGNALLNPLHAKYCDEFKKRAKTLQKAILKEQYRTTSKHSYLGGRKKGY